MPARCCRCCSLLLPAAAAAAAAASAALQPPLLLLCCWRRRCCRCCCCCCCTVSSAASLLPAAARLPYVRTMPRHCCSRGVIDAIEKQLELTPSSVAPSRETLYRYGNVSSSSIWWVEGVAEAAAAGWAGHGARLASQLQLPYVLRHAGAAADPHPTHPPMRPPPPSLSTPIGTCCPTLRPSAACARASASGRSPLAQASSATRRCGALSAL